MNTEQSDYVQLHTHTTYSYFQYLSTTLIYQTYLPTNMTKLTLL